MIRVMIVDDHPALRAGLMTVLRREPGIVPCASVSSADEALRELDSRPDVVLVDYRLPERHGLDLCREIKRLENPPRVLIYSAHATDALTLPARLAGADGMVDKKMPADVLFEAIRTVAGGGSVFPPARRDLMDSAAETIDAKDLPLLGMLHEDTTLDEVADVLRLDRASLDERLGEVIEALRPTIEGA